MERGWWNIPFYSGRRPVYGTYPISQEGDPQFPDKIVLLGIQPDAPEEEYGWIQPGERILGYNGFEISEVERFHEKPDLLSAQKFFKQGYLWNTLVMVARCSTLWDLVKEALPDIHHRFEKIIPAIGTAEYFGRDSEGRQISFNLKVDLEGSNFYAMFKM